MKHIRFIFIAIFGSLLALAWAAQYDYFVYGKADSALALTKHGIAADHFGHVWHDGGKFEATFTLELWVNGRVYNDKFGYYSTTFQLPPDPSEKPNVVVSWRVRPEDLGPGEHWVEFVGIPMTDTIKENPESLLKNYFVYRAIKVVNRK